MEERNGRTDSGNRLSEKGRVRAGLGAGNLESEGKSREYFQSFSGFGSCSRPKDQLEDFFPSAISDLFNFF